MISIQNSLSDDVALKIVSSLEASDVCSLGSCSRYWRELCGSDCVWKALCRDRWPALGSQSHQLHQLGWRDFYVKKHHGMAVKAACIFDFVERCFAFESIEVSHHLKAIDDLHAMQFGFKDILMLFLRPNVNVLLNLIGLQYCITMLEVPAESIAEALRVCRISERQVCVKWWKLGRWFYGFHLRDELHSSDVALGDLSSSKEEEVLGVLRRGAIHELVRVQISVAKPAPSPPWSCQSRID